MTLRPSETWDVVGVTGPKYSVGPRCSCPTCNKWADHAHHIWARSKVGGDFNYVRIADTTVQNLTGLCVGHHEQITGMIGGHRARINYDGESFSWMQLSVVDNTTTEVLLGLLKPQPAPLGAAVASLPEPTSKADGSAERCPSCGHAKKPKEELPPGEKRPKKQWSITVPVDERENGVEVIETLLAAIAEKLGRDQHQAWKYYTLVEALVFVTQNLGGES